MESEIVSKRTFLVVLLLISITSFLFGFVIRGPFIKDAIEPKLGVAELLFSQGIDPFGPGADIEVMFPTPDYSSGKIVFSDDMYQNQHEWKGELAFLEARPDISGFIFSKNGLIVGVGVFDKPLGSVSYSKGMYGPYVSLKRYRPVFLEGATGRSIRFEPR
jgi:hypothetical protein